MPNNFQKLFPTTFMKILLLLYLATLVWWITIFGRGIVNTSENFFFNAPLGLLPIIAGIGAIFEVSRKHSINHLIKKTVIPISLGIVSWGIGAWIWLYYNFILQIAVPYPSVADFFFLTSYPLWFLGIIYMCHTAQLQFQLKGIASKAVLFLLPAVMIAASYYLMFIVAHGGPQISEINFKIVLDFLYLLSDMVMLGALAVVMYGLLFGRINSLYAVPFVFIVFGFLAYYIADFVFTFSTTTGTYFVSHWTDMCYLTSFFLLALGIYLLSYERANKPTDQAE